MSAEVKPMWAAWRVMQAAICLISAGCSAASPPAAEPHRAPFALRAVAAFDTPWAMDFLPAIGRAPVNAALVSEKDGRLWLVNVDSGERKLVAGVPKVHVAGQGGLGDVVVDPGFAGTRRIYLTFVEKAADGRSGAVLGHGTLERIDGQPRLANFKIIWRQDPKVEGEGHFSHRIAFGPDGHLYLSSGDRQKFDPAQDMGMNLGKVLRLTREGRPAAGNPWPAKGRIAAQFWTIGHRNVLGLAFAPDGRLWASEMGPKGGDELNLLLAGRNYGWPRASNGSHYDGRDIPDHRPGDGFEPPKIWWNPSISPGGLLIYGGDRFKGWKGDALLPALSGQALIRVDINGDKAAKADQWDMGTRIRAIDQGPDGRLFILEDGGRLVELTPR